MTIVSPQPCDHIQKDLYDTLNDEQKKQFIIDREKMFFKKDISAHVCVFLYESDRETKGEQLRQNISDFLFEHDVHAYVQVYAHGDRGSENLLKNYLKAQWQEFQKENFVDSRLKILFNKFIQKHQQQGETQGVTDGSDGLATQGDL